MDIKIKVRKGFSQILKILKKMINFEDFSISLENNNAKKHKKASVVSNNIPHDEYIENNKKMFEMLSVFSYDSKNYVDFIKKISEHFQFGDRSYQFKCMCTAHFRTEPIKYYSGIYPVCECIFSSLDTKDIITEKDIERRLGYTSSTLDFFKEKTEKNKINFLDLVNTTRAYKKYFKTL